MAIDDKAKTEGEGITKLLCTMTHYFEKGQRDYCFEKGYSHCLLYQFLDNPLYRKKELLNHQLI